MKRSISVFFLAILILSAAVSAAVQKKMTIEDSLSVKQVSSPQLSPDGKWVAYSLSEWNRKENRRFSHIWMVSTDGGPSVRLTNGERGETGPQWSADGRQIAFLADRSEKGGSSQIWIIPAFGGEAEKLTSEENSVQSFRWSPDGKTIAFVTRDMPKDKAEREKRQKEKFDTIVVDSDFTFSHLWTIDVVTREKKRLTEGEFSVTDPRWSPDGKQIAFVHSKNGAQDSSFVDISANRDTDIYVVSVEGGPPSRLTTNRAADSSPRWSPDGNWIAYVANTEPDSWAVKNDVMIIPRTGGTSFNLTGEFTESAGSNLHWSPDGSQIFFSAATGVYTHIFRIEARPNAAINRMTKENRNYGSFDITGTASMIKTFPTPPLNPNQPAYTPNWKMAYTVSDSLTPEDVWIAPLNSMAEARKVTWINPQVRDFTLGETSVIKWKGPDHFDIEGMLLKPVGYQEGKRYPTILMIHGGPYGRFADNFNSRAQIFAANGYVVLMPNPRGSTGYGNKFATANIGDWGGKDFKDIMAGVDAVIARGIADPDKLVVMGGSYGGFMTFWTITQTDRFKAAIGHAGISDWYSFHGQSDIPGLMEYGFIGQPWTSTETYRKFSPMTYVDRVKTPIMITHGERDLRVPIAQAEQYYRALKKRGVEVVFLRFPREGHGIQEPNHVIDLVERQLQWFDKHLNITREKPAQAKAAGGK